jgi:hypothetical protein
MPRSGPSTADQALISQLAARDLTVSLAQLERWRSAGLLPRNARQGRGRGRGSSSALAPQAVEIAAVLARHARQGRDLRLAVVDWFAAAGLQVPDSTPVPEPPAAAVHAAVQWIIATSPAYQLLRTARSARTDAEIDQFYETADRALSRVPAVTVLDVAETRDALLTGLDPEEQTSSPTPLAFRGSVIQLIATIGLGFGEVGADALAEAVTAAGLFPGHAADDWEGTAGKFAQLEKTGSPLVDQLLTRYNPLDMVDIANAEMLLQARTVAHGLAGFGVLYLMHALLMPDTPALSALRALIDELGIAQLLMAMSQGAYTTSGFAHHLVACLHPWYWALHDLLTSHAANGPPLFHRPDGGHTAEQFMQDWIAALTNCATRTNVT